MLNSIRTKWQGWSWPDRLAVVCVFLAIGALALGFLGVEWFAALGWCFVLLVCALLFEGSIALCSEEAKALLVGLAAVFFFFTLNGLGASIDRYALASQTLDSLLAGTTNKGAATRHRLHDDALDACRLVVIDRGVDVTREAVVGSPPPLATPIVGMLVGKVRPSRCLELRAKILKDDQGYFGLAD